MAKQGMTRGLDKLGNRSIAARNNLNKQNIQQAQSPEGVSSQSPNSTPHHASNNSSVNSESLSASPSRGAQGATSSKSQSSFISRSLDKSIIATDNVMNFKKNHVASRAVKTDIRKGGSGLSKESKASLFNKYKQNAHKQFHQMRPVDYQVSKVRGEAINNPEWKKAKKSNFKGRRV
jgi:hypothetical protein